MTNYYQEGWNLVSELTAEQVTWLLEFREALGSRGDDEPVPDKFYEHVERYLVAVGYDEAEAEQFMYCPADYMNFDVENGEENLGTSIVIGYEESFNPDDAAEFLKIFLDHFKLDRHIILEWAGYPSNQKPGDYYGGAVLVTSEEIYWFIPGALAEEKSESLRRELEKES